MVSGTSANAVGAGAIGSGLPQVVFALPIGPFVALVEVILQSATTGAPSVYCAPPTHDTALPPGAGVFGFGSARTPIPPRHLVRSRELSSGVCPSYWWRKCGCD